MLKLKLFFAVIEQNQTLRLQTFGHLFFPMLFCATYLQSVANILTKSYVKAMRRTCIYLSSLLLNTFKLEAVTISSGSELHVLTSES